MIQLFAANKGLKTVYMVYWASKFVWEYTFQMLTQIKC